MIRKLAVFTILVISLAMRVEASEIPVNHVKDKIVKQTIYDEAGGKGVKQTFKPGKQKEILPNDTKLCSNDKEREELSIMQSSSVI